mmetsp:Transcript_19072/g.54969  ORF Transcript_19072/g.54969 Transcript_19072/m.54969 type:complete len:332 (+) Transcript_19072:131-1126(+)
MLRGDSIARRAATAATAAAAAIAMSTLPTTIAMRMDAATPPDYAVPSSVSAYRAGISELSSKVTTARVLVPSRGSGNYGESGQSAFYTIDDLPPPLNNMAKSAAAPDTLKRTDIDLGPDRLAFYIDDVLSHDEADALASCAESILELNGHSRIAPGIITPSGMRINEAAHWYPPRASIRGFLGTLFSRFKHLVPQTLGDGYGGTLRLHPKLSEKVAQFKYNDADRFNRHVDGLFPGQGINETGDGVEEWPGVVSGMSMLFYLNDWPNDELVGGETRLWSASGESHVDVTPAKGRALFFRRGSPDAVLHAGLPVSGDVPKYMALINLAYETE